MYITRKMLAIIVLVLMLISVSSCEKASQGGFLRILELPARAELKGVRYGVEFGAILTQGAYEGDGMREARLEYTYPAALEGIIVEYSFGVFAASLGGITFSGPSAEKLAAPLTVFLADGEVISAERVEGEPKTRILLKKQENSYEYIIDSKSGLPLSVIELDCAGEKIMEIEVITYEIE